MSSLPTFYQLTNGYYLQDIKLNIRRKIISYLTADDKWLSLGELCSDNEDNPIFRYKPI